MTSRTTSIGRGAIITACNILECIDTNAEIETMLLEYGLSDYVKAQGSISKTVLELKKFAVKNPNHRVETDFGEKFLVDLIIEEAIKRVRWADWSKNLWEKLERYLNIDGYSILKETDWQGKTAKITGFTSSTPKFAKLPESASEVEVLLEQYDFKEALTHLSSAKENITQSDWVAANSQCRTFLEALLNSIADYLFPDDASHKQKGLPKRQLLAEKNFLSREKFEFGDSPKQSFLPGLFGLLNFDGSHPGISNQHDAMFRLQAVTITAHWLLKRLETWQNQ